jgi:hypothetical protein
LKAQNAEFSMNDIECESAIAAPLHLVPSREEPAHTFKDVLVDATVCLAPRAVAKVVGPASQRPVQLVTYFRPWIDIARRSAPSRRARAIWEANRLAPFRFAPVRSARAAMPGRGPHDRASRRQASSC